MKLLTYKPEIKSVKEYEGILSASFTHKIQSADAVLEYKGPMLTKETWDQVLAFFQWTNDTAHSESQVRFFVNTRTNQWAAWAFPQEARTGMTARELDTDDMKKQRALFGDADGWVYFGTAHHHCSATAFQSGTDRANEETIDGLHLTVGSMSSTAYDLHARFYLGGCCFEPDMSKFWYIGDELSKLLPRDLWDRVARFQMCTKVPTGTEFPAQWRANVIEVKQVFPVQAQTSIPGAYGSAWSRNSLGVPQWLRARRAVGQLALEVLPNPYDQKAQLGLAMWIKELATPPSTSEIAVLVNILAEYDVHIDTLWQEIPHDNSLTACITTYKASLAEGAVDDNSIHPRKGKKNKSNGVVVAGTPPTLPDSNGSLAEDHGGYLIGGMMD